MAVLNDLLRFFDPVSLLLVLGGSLLVASLRSSRDDVRRAFAALRPLFKADPTADAYAAIVAVGKIEKLTELRSINCVDRVDTAERFLRRAGRRLAGAPTSDAFERWCALELESRDKRHRNAIAFWRMIAETAPSMGMMGTIIGLVQMFSRMDDVATIGSAMALAMLTTLYGVILSSAIASPIASRLERLSSEELMWQRRALDRLQLVAEAEIPPRPLAPGKPALRTVT